MTRDDFIDIAWGAMSGAQDVDTTMADSARVAVDTVAVVDLYDALNNLMRRLDSHFGGPERSYDWKEQEDARAALAKARGEPTITLDTVREG